MAMVVSRMVLPHQRTTNRAFWDRYKVAKFRRHKALNVRHYWGCRVVGNLFSYNKIVILSFYSRNCVIFASCMPNNGLKRKIKW